MPESDQTVGARVELRLLSQDETKLNLHVLLGGQPIFQDTVTIDRAGSRDYFLRALRKARPDLKEDEALAVSQRLEDLSLEPPPEKSEREGGPVSGTPREELVRQRDERADKLLKSMPEAVVVEAAEMLAAPDLVDRILADVAALGVVGERDLVLTVYLLGTSRLLDSPLAAIVQGPSSAGKSFVVETVARLFPDEATLRATDLTPQALYYFPEDALIHRFVVAGERRRGKVDELADATRALREMLASKVLRKAVAVKQGDHFVTDEVTRFGPISFLETTTLTRIFDEDQTRCLLLAADEQATQTREVLRHQAERAAGADAPNVERIILRHQAAQRLLRRTRVRIPFAPQIGERVPDDRPEARRAFNLSLSVVAASALLHQRQRVSDGLRHGDRIDATLDDYRLAYALLKAPLGRALGGDISPAALRFGHRLFWELGGKDVTAAEAAHLDATVKSPGKAREYLNELSDHGVAEIVDQGRGSKPKVFRMKNEPSDVGATWLPHPDSIDLRGSEAVAGTVGSPPRAPDGATVRQPSNAPGGTAALPASGSVSAPRPEGRPSAEGAEREPWDNDPPPRTEPPQEGGGDENPYDWPDPPNPEESDIVAPSPHGDALEGGIQEHFPGAERVPDFPEPPADRREGGTR